MATSDPSHAGVSAASGGGTTPHGGTTTPSRYTSTPLGARATSVASTVNTILSIPGYVAAGAVIVTMLPIRVWGVGAVGRSVVIDTKPPEGVVTAVSTGVSAVAPSPEMSVLTGMPATDSSTFEPSAFTTNDDTRSPGT